MSESRLPKLDEETNAHFKPDRRTEPDREKPSDRRLYKRTTGLGKWRGTFIALVVIAVLCIVYLVFYK